MTETTRTASEIRHDILHLASNDHLEYAEAEEEVLSDCTTAEMASYNTFMARKNKLI